MNRYRAYMGRIHAPAGLRRRVLEAAERGERPRSPVRRRLGAGALAACFALAFFGGWQVWQAAGPYQPDPTAGVADPPAAASPAPAETEHTLVVGDPFDGQPHGFFDVPALEFADCTDFAPYQVDWGWRVDSFHEALSAEEIITALGGTDEVPWTLLWSGFGLDGTAAYDGEGQVLLAAITGVSGDTSFTLELAPGQLPPGGESYAGAAVQDYDGVAVTAWYTRPDGDGAENYTYCVEFINGDMGVRFTCDSPDQETASWLASVLVWNAARADSGFTTEHLAPDAIPHRDEQLTLDEAREDPLGAWLPSDLAVPDDFFFGGSTRYQEETQDNLSAIWVGGGALMLQVVVYASGSAAPEADLTIDEVTIDVLRELGIYPEDSEEADSWRWSSLVVDWGDGIRVRYSLQGLTVMEAAKLIHSAPAGIQVRESTADGREDGGVVVPIPIPSPSPWQVFPLE